MNLSELTLHKPNRALQVQSQPTQEKLNAHDSDALPLAAEFGLIELVNCAGLGHYSGVGSLLMRALGHGMRVAVVEFMPGAISDGEEKFLRRFSEEISYYSVSVDHVQLSADMTEESDAHFEAQAVQRVNAAWQQALGFLRQPEIDLLILLDLNFVLNSAYLNVHQVVQHLLKRPLHQNVLITGGEVPPELLEIADTVSELRVIRKSNVPSLD